MTDRKQYNRRKFVIKLMIILLGMGIAFHKMDGIYRVMSSAKSQIKGRMEYTIRNKKRDLDFEKERISENDSHAWYKEYHVVSHSGGGIDGKRYTNSLEAWENAYECGNRVFDADLSFTSDDILVLRHEWFDNLEQENISENDIPTFKEFMSTPVYHKYTPMSCYDMIRFLAEHEECYAACDFKGDGTKTFSFLVQAAKDMDCEKVLDRIIVSFYSYKDYEEISQVYAFHNWAIRQYQNEPHNYYELAEFCLNHNIPVCMIQTDYLDAGDDISVLTDNGITIFAAVVNELSDMEQYLHQGVSGCVSDYLYEADFQYIE